MSKSVDRIDACVGTGDAGIGEKMRALRILIAEDDALIGMLLEEMLTAIGHTICAIEATETDTVAAALKYRPDMMIIDAWLGEGSGIAAVETILRTRFIPHAFASGDTLRVKALRPGAIVIEKPFSEKDLERAIQQALGASASP